MTLQQKNRESTKLSFSDLRELPKLERVPFYSNSTSCSIFDFTPRVTIVYVKKKEQKYYVNKNIRPGLPSDHWPHSKLLYFKDRVAGSRTNLVWRCLILRMEIAVKICWMRLTRVRSLRAVQRIISAISVDEMS